MFIDQVTIHVEAGTGGSGAASFARFKYKPKGGPDGGDGGDGGSVYIKADGNLSTLLDYRYTPNWKAQRGLHGKGKNMTGRSGEDLYLPVPPGTEIRDSKSGDLIGEVLGTGGGIPASPPRPTRRPANGSRARRGRSGISPSSSS
jgi:GTP-binding protein